MNTYHRAKSPNRAVPAPLWLKVRARAIGFRRDDLERTHWKKAGRLIIAD